MLQTVVYLTDIQIYNQYESCNYIKEILLYTNIVMPKLQLVQFNSQNTTGDTMNHSRRKPPIRTIYLADKCQTFFPVMVFYRDKGIKEIYIENVCSREITLLTDLGETTFTDIQILEMMKESLKVQSLDDFFYMTNNNIMAWIKILTQRDISIQGLSYTTYFGVTVLKQYDKRNLTKEEEDIEENIRKQFILPQFEKEEISSSLPCILQ